MKLSFAPWGCSYSPDDLEPRKRSGLSIVYLDLPQCNNILNQQRSLNAPDEPEVQLCRYPILDVSQSQAFQFPLGSHKCSLPSTQEILLYAYYYAIVPSLYIFLTAICVLLDIP